MADLRRPEVGRAPHHEVHGPTDASRYGTTESGEPLPVDGPDDGHVDVAVDGITA
jgi:hypothetical protein